MDQLQLAIEDHQSVRLTYQSATRHEPVTYEMHPYGLVEHRGTLYMVGHSVPRRAVRTWKLDRVVDVELLDSKFCVPDDFNLRDFMQSAFAVIRGDKLHRIKVRFDPSAARYVQEKRMHPSQRKISGADGSVTLGFELSSLVEIQSWILSFGSQAEVLEPAELRESVAAEVKQLADRYCPAPTVSMRRSRSAK